MTSNLDTSTHHYPADVLDLLVRQLVDVKDSVTRINLDRQREQDEHRKRHEE